MHVVLVDHFLKTPPTGGTHTCLVNLCTTLSKDKHQVSVITEPGPEATLANLIEGSGCKVFDNIWRAVDLPEDRAQHLAGWVNEQQADVFVVSVSPDAGWLALPLLNRRTATACITHSDGPTFYRPLSHYHDFVDCAIGVSKETCSQMIAQCAMPPARVHHIPYGVPSLSRDELAAHVGAPERELRAAYIGRLVQSQKRVLDIIPLVQEIAQRDLPVEFHIIGDGDERERLRIQLASYIDRGRVKLWCWLDPSAVRERLLDLDAIVLFSDLEGLPLALLEGMAHATVPIVTAIPSGAAEVIQDGENGFLVPVGDISQFVDRLQLLLEDPQRTVAMKRAAWETAQRYSVRRMTDSYLKCFEQARKERLAREAARETPQAFPAMASCFSPYPFWARRIKRRLALAISALK
jgi:colanic acid/amylovoran biosynthesis glycosyltransferase